MTESETRSASEVVRRPVLWLAPLLALLAAGVAAYLAVTSRYGLPLGCGNGSGCSEVLQSRWAALFGVPVGYYALAAYAMLLTPMIAASLRPTALRETGRFLLIASAGAIAGAALWFIFLQVVALRAICVWCMIDHLLGTTAAVAAVVWVMRNDQVARLTGRETHRFSLPLAMGLTLAAGFVALQIGFSSDGSALVRLPGGQNADTGPSVDRQIAVLGGELTLAVRELPVLGSPEAAHLLVLLYDYACPHCRTTHGYLVEGLDRYPGQYGIVLLPMPLDSTCNPTVEETEPRFKDSCELARLALAVWRASPGEFAQFDAWLYDSESPRSVAEARDRAESLAGREQLDAALADEWVSARIAADIKAYQSSQAGQIPVLLSPAIDTVVGRPESSSELFSLLERELGLRTAAPSESSRDYARQ